MEIKEGDSIEVIHDCAVISNSSWKLYQLTKGDIGTVIKKKSSDYYIVTFAGIGKVAILDCFFIKTVEVKEND